MNKNIIRDENGWETVAADVKYPGPHLALFIEHVRTPERREPFFWTVVRRPSAAVVAPMTPEGKFILIKQERIPVRNALWEFPAGQIDGTDSPDDAAIRDTALRELREEAGCELGAGGELIPLGYFFSSAGFTDEHSYLFLARGVIPSPDGHQHDEGERIIEARAFASEELRAMIASNEIRDANTLSVFARLCALGLLPMRQGSVW